MFLSRILKSFDIFGQPFKFKTDPGLDNKDLVKKTQFGSLFSGLCVIISILYFAFLVEEFFAGRVPPVLSEVTIQSTAPIQEQFDSNPLDIVILTPKAYKDVDIEEYFTVNLVSIGVLDSETTQLTDSSPGKKGEQNMYQYVINETKQIELRQNPNDKLDNQYFAIVIQKCQPGGSVTCKSDTEIETLVSDDDTEIEIQVHYDELQVISGKLEKKTKDIFSAIDPEMVQVMELQLYMGLISTDNGFLWAIPKVRKFVKSFAKHSEFYNADYVEARLGADNPAYLDALKVVQIKLARQSHENFVVYEKFTQVIAKFMAFFNTVVIIGMIAKAGSEAKIFEMIMDSYIQSYYKASAAELYSKRKEIDAHKGGKNSIHEKNYQKIQDFNDIFPQKYEPVINWRTYKSAYMHSQGPANYNKYIKKLEKQKEGNEPKTMEFKDEAQNLNLKELQEQVYVSQYAKVHAQFDFRTLYMEVMEVKAGLQMLFTPEQYAAVQYVGRSISLDNNTDISKAESRNHLEKIDMIQENNVYKNLKLREFMKNSEGSGSELDKKIRACLVPQVAAVMKNQEDFAQKSDFSDFSKQKKIDDDDASPKFLIDTEEKKMDKIE